MNRTAVALSLIIALSISMLAGMRSNVAVTAVWEEYVGPSSVVATVQSPQGAVTNPVSLVFIVQDGTGPVSSYINYYYALDQYIEGTKPPTASDWASLQKANLTTIKTAENIWGDQRHNFSYTIYFVEGRTILPPLSDGVHSVTIYSRPENDRNLGIYLCTSFFTVDNNPPSISVLSPQNKSYTSNVPMDFAISNSTSRITYSLDQNENKTVVGNFTLANLPRGVHNITAYAWSPLGYVAASNTVIFSVADPFNVVNQATQYDATLTIALGGSLAVTALGLLFYFIKVKKRKNENTLA